MNIDFDKYPNGLVPAIVQNEKSGRVLMLGFMNEEALEYTRSSGKATFYSRSKKRLWTKGETSGNFLLVSELLEDCDSDTLLLKVSPYGSACHKGTDTCFGEADGSFNFLFRLEQIIKDRKANPVENSYTSQLFNRGINKIAQKVGEETVELIIEAKDSNDVAFKGEAADLLYHFLILLQAKETPLYEVLTLLETRHYINRR